MGCRLGRRGAITSIQSRIAETFDGKAFLRPLFYTYPGGLRFELSEGGSAITQFLCALQKATRICAGIFSAAEPITVCFRAHSYGFSHRSAIRELRDVGIRIPRQREFWLELVPTDERCQDEDEEDEWWINLAFETTLDLLPNLLWCAFAQDFAIRPCPRCCVYLFELKTGVLVMPYDDRGMDVVGPNHTKLKALYDTFNANLLDYNRKAMQATFESD